MNLTRSGIPIAIVLWLLPALAAYGQPTTQLDEARNTKLEQLQGETGVVLIRDYADVGRVSAFGAASVIAMILTDTATATKQAGIVLEVKDGGRLGTKDRSFIDDEIEPLLKSIDHISKIEAGVPRLGNYEASYTTRGHFTVATFFNPSSGVLEAAVKSSNGQPATAYMSIKQFRQLRDLIATAKEKLDAAK